MLLLCRRARPRVRKSERCVRFTAERWLAFCQVTFSFPDARFYARLRAQLSGRGGRAGVDDLSIYCRARQVAADSSNAGLDLQLGRLCGGELFSAGMDIPPDASS